jgi:hypothetical protein
VWRSARLKTSRRLHSALWASRGATVINEMAAGEPDSDTCQPIQAAVFQGDGPGWRAIALTVDGVFAGFTQMACGDCIGSGVFLLPDDETTRCWTCKGSGLVGVAC